MPIHEAADKALKAFQEEFMPAETFSEFLDAAGQCQGFSSSQTIVGLAVAFIFVRGEKQARTSLWVTSRRSGGAVCLPAHWLTRCSRDVGLRSAQALCPSRTCFRGTQGSRCEVELLLSPFYKVG